MNKLWLIAGGPALVYAGLAIIMGVLPGIALSQTPPGIGVKPLTPIEAEGRAIYAANGCGYCHTQQVRPLAQDKVFGRPSAPGDFAYQTPELLGSERTGPDLTDIGTRQPSAVWQYMHLYNPRSVAPQSIMPSFSWMFDVVDKAPVGTMTVPVPAAYAPAEGVVIPSHQAQALLAYLMSLKQPPLAQAVANEAATPAAPAATAPSPTASSSTTPAKSAAAYDPAKGKSLFTDKCAICHQAGGTGLPGAFPPLKGNAVVNDANPSAHIHTVLHGAEGLTIGGVKYEGAMPEFASTLTDAEIAAIIDYERSSWGNHSPTITAAQVAAERAKGK
ncbi:MAG TPA: cbb3-type cytochrome c oxidase subunit II [Roseiarcus sp.]|nr:cbb3-type cytochrome c oxidase subunit II [Roseiarcus sp.]